MIVSIVTFKAMVAEKYGSPPDILYAEVPHLVGMLPWHQT